ncbi:MAG: IMP dehydrogenase [Prevotellaceae bacterium]|jgi:IMP dehydrogenase|nr:IMP dehydrogenase [Prevotellaceae bacterium]
MSFLNDKIKGEGFTFDDVLLVPSRSEILPYQVDISSKLTQNIRLSTPIVSAAMDTVTEAELAIAIARKGGIGVIHKNMSIGKQTEQVKQVKRAENGMIYDPITITKDATVGDVINVMHEFKIGGIPVIDKDNKLLGIVTNRDLRFQEDMKTPISDVMTTKNLITTTNKTNLKEAAEILKKYRIEKLPVVDENYKLTGLLTFKDITKIKDNPEASKDLKGRLRVAAGVGVTGDTLERIASLTSADVDAVVIDTAHGHTRSVVEMLKKVKKQFPNLDVIAGNIATGEAAIDLMQAGADALKVGIGPGSICTTRIIAGVGVPQLTAIYDVAKAVNGKIPVIADGGIRYSGDIVKALAAGADVIMAGSLFAGVEESPGETIILNGRKFKSYRGMGSLEAMQSGSKDRYFQDYEDDIKKLVPEGIVAQVPYKGKLEEVIYQLVGGLRAGMGYCGTPNIKTLQKAHFIRITAAGVVENHPHDVTITREAPNYSR